MDGDHQGSFPCSLSSGSWLVHSPLLLKNWSQNSNSSRRIRWGKAPRCQWVNHSLSTTPLQATCHASEHELPIVMWRILSDPLIVIVRLSMITWRILSGPLMITIEKILTRIKTQVSSVTLAHHLAPQLQVYNKANLVARQPQPKTKSKEDA